MTYFGITYDETESSFHEDWVLLNVGAQKSMFENEMYNDLLILSFTKNYLYFCLPFQKDKTNRPKSSHLSLKYPNTKSE